MADAPKSSKNSQRFGPYMVGETIGRGTFAKVKIAVHETTKVRVALKIISRKMMDSDAHSALKIEREIKIMQVLRHPHITRLYDVVQTKHDIVLVMEFVSGGELFDFISRKGRLDEATARSLFQQLAAAVAFCHRYRVTHRDIKPENIMMEHGSHNIKLSDFGLSNITHDGRFFDTSCGTPNYASPEVVSGQLYGGPETDVWSCGVVLYAMLTVTLPFDDNNVASLFKKIQTADFPAPRNVSREAADLIKRMLLVNPLDRATMEQVMQHPWLKPQFPPYLLSLHYEAVLDAMRFAKDHSVTEDMLDDEVVRVVASRFRISPRQVVAIVTREEERVPSMWAVVTEDRRTGIVTTRRYPAAPYWETFSNVLDAKLWPTPLEIIPAEVALRDESHDIFISYLILSQKKQNKLGHQELSNASFGESASNLLQSQSQQGYGSLNANSLHQLSTSSSFTGSSFAQTAPGLQRSKVSDKKTGDKTFFTLPDKSASIPQDSACAADPDDAWMDGYNSVAAPFLPLHHEQSRHTLLGSLFAINELPVGLLRSHNLSVQPVPRATGGGGGQGALLHPVGSLFNDEEASTGSLLRPLADNGSGAIAKQRSCSSNVSVSGASRSSRTAGRGTDGQLRADNSEPEAVLETIYRVNVATRFGNDFIRHGVLFRPATAQEALKATYEAMREEGLIWRTIYDYYFSCVRFPNVKIQVKVYKVSKTEQIVDLRVSVQSGMEAFDAAVSLLDRLRTKAVELANRGGKKPKKRNSLLSHFSSPSSTASSKNKGKGKAGDSSSRQGAGSSGKASVSSNSSTTAAKRQ